MRPIESAIRRRREVASFDAANRPTYQWAEEPLPNCALAPNAAVGGAREPEQVGRNQVRSGATAYFPGEIDVLATDELVIRGQVWQVDGEIEVWHNPFTRRRGLASGTVVHLKRSTEGGA